MWSYEKARSSVRNHLGVEFVILDDHTQSYEFGWVFFYKSRRDEAVAGNAPLIVRRDTGRIVVTGTATEIEKYVDAFRLTGSTTSKLADRLVITGWMAGANAVAAIKAIKERCGMGLADAKLHVDLVLNGHVEVVRATSSEDAMLLMLALNDAGMKVCRIYEEVVDSRRR